LSWVVAVAVVVDVVDVVVVAKGSKFWE